MNKSPLPIEIETEDSSKAAWTPFLTALGFIAVVNLALCMTGMVRHTHRQEEDLLRAKWTIANNGDRSFDWIVMGDSSGTFGVDPTQMSRALRGDTVNLCTFGSMGIAGDLWMLDEYLDHHEPPRGVVVVHAADVWTTGRGEAMYQYSAAIPESTSSVLVRLLAARSSPSEIFHFLKYRDVFPLLFLKKRFRQLIGWSTDLASTDQEELRLPENGEMRMHKDRVNRDHVERHSTDYWIELEKHRDTRDQELLDVMIQRAEEGSFDLYLANGPIAEHVKNSPGFVSEVASIRSKLDELASAHPHVHVVLENWVAYPASTMENANHVVGTAVDDYTQRLSEAILSSDH